MRQVGTDECDVAGPERTNVVARNQLAAALANQMNFELRMVVPASQRVGVIVFVPAKAMIGLGKNDLQFRGSLFEQGGSAIRHDMALLSLFVLGLRPTYALSISACYC